jgi:hypothetical protein
VVSTVSPTSSNRNDPAAPATVERTEVIVVQLTPPSVDRSTRKLFAANRVPLGFAQVIVSEDAPTSRSPQAEVTLAGGASVSARDPPVPKPDAVHDAPAEPVIDTARAAATRTVAATLQRRSERNDIAARL